VGRVPTGPPDDRSTRGICLNCSGTTARLPQIARDCLNSAGTGHRASGCTRETSVI